MPSATTTATMNTAVPPKMPSREFATKNSSSGPMSRPSLRNGLSFGLSVMEWI